MLCWFCIVQNFWQATKASLLWGEAPVQVVSHLCHCIVQWLCAADCKHPCLVWGGSPGNIAPARRPGVYAARLCRTQSQPSIHSPLPWGRGLGLGIENKHFFGKTDFFYKLIRLHTQADLFISYIDTNELVMYNQIRNKKEEKIC